MIEKELTMFEGDRRFGFVPFAISIALVFVIVGTLPEIPLVALFCILVLFHTWNTLGPLVRAGAQRVSVTDTRIRGEVNFGVLSGQPRTTFSIPYSEIVETKRDLLSHQLKIKVAGFSKDVTIIGLRDAHVLENFLANIVAIRRQGAEYSGVNAWKPWPRAYNRLMAAIHDTADIAAGEIPPDVEESEPVDLSARDARVEFTGTWIKGLFLGLLVVLGVVAAVLFGAYAVAVTDAKERFGGNTVCVTAARAYRDALPRAVNLSLEKVDNDPGNMIGRAVLSQLAGRLLAEAYTDDAFAGREEFACGIDLATEYYNRGHIATLISDALERELKNMVN